VRTDPAPESGIIELEMGYGADEFGKVLTGAFTGDKSDYRCEAISIHQWRISQTDSDLAIQIKVSEKPPRKLGLFVLPVLQVEFQTLDTTADLQKKFFERFHQYFHKGGG
jgi:hypothetical protein